MGNKSEGNKGNIEDNYSVYLQEDSYEEDNESAEKVDSLPEEKIAKDEKKVEKNENMEDISSSEKPQKKHKFSIWWHNRKKWQKVLLIICVVLIVLILVVGGFVWHKLSMMDTNGEDDFISDEAYEDDINMADMNSITDASSLNDLLIKWANNGGEKMHSKYVKNVLLVGVRDGLADSMILASLNEKTKQINLISFYRDSYTYIQPAGKKAKFAKMNAAYSAGGAKCLVKTIEDDYKVKIDEYVVVDTNSFVKVVDALGGVDVNVTEKEANYLNRTWREWTFTGNQVSYNSGMNHLNGEKALMFCRIRHLDSDINRTERQRRVITAMINKFKNSSVSELNGAVNALLPNVKTSMSKTQILGFAADAVSGGWLKYPLAQTTMPTTDTSKGGMLGDQWVWIVDYQGAAYQLQNLLYGKSNIKLEDGRVSAIGIKPTTSTNVGTTSSNKTTTHSSVTTTKANNSSTTSEVNTTEDNTNISESEITTTTEKETSSNENENGLSPSAKQALAEIKDSFNHFVR